jgi:hypothetical protein
VKLTFVDDLAVFASRKDATLFRPQFRAQFTVQSQVEPEEGPATGKVKTHSLSNPFVLVGAGVAELADAQDLGCEKALVFYASFQRLMLDSVKQYWGVFDEFGESFGESLPMPLRNLPQKAQN